jgi:hypothetical protein
VSAVEDAQLRAIAHSAFALEYRLRSAYDAVGLTVAPKVGLWPLLDQFASRATGRPGIGGKKVRLPKEWDRLLVRLKHLADLRNRIAHGRKDGVRSLREQRRPSLRIEARRAYNSFVDAVRVVNGAIGNETRHGVELRRYYADLKVHRG